MQPIWTIVRPLALALLVACSGCESFWDSLKPKDELPPATQKGARTLGFKLNGEIWEGNGIQQGQLIDDRLSIKSQRFLEGDDEDRFYLFIREYDGSMNVELSNSTVNINKPYRTVILRVRREGSSKRYENDSNHTITTEFSKFDSVERIMAGRFHGTLVNDQDPNDTMVVTDGRFDVTF